MSDWKKPEVWVAAYAAFVATLVAAFQIREWLTAGPRLRVVLIPDAKIIGGDPSTDENDLVSVSVTNVGTADTMITHLSVERRDPFYYFFFRKHYSTAWLIPNPQMKGYPPNIPHLLKPAHTWVGVIRNSGRLADGKLRNGDYCAVVTVSTSRKGIAKRIKLIGAKQNNQTHLF